MFNNLNNSNSSTITNNNNHKAKATFILVKLQPNHMVQDKLTPVLPQGNKVKVIRCNKAVKTHNKIF